MEFDAGHYTSLIIGAMVTLIVVIGVMIPIFGGLDDSTMIKGNNANYTTMADIWDYRDNGTLQDKDIISCTLVNNTSLAHVELLRLADPTNLSSYSRVWEEWVETGDVIAVWSKGAVVRYADSLGIIAFDSNSGRAYTNVGDINLDIQNRNSDISVTLKIFSGGQGSSLEANDLGTVDEDSVYIPRHNGRLAYYKLSDGAVNINDTAIGIALGSSGSVAAYAYTEIITEGDTPTLSDTAGGFFDTTDEPLVDSRPNMFSMTEATPSATLDATRANEYYSTISELDIIVNGMDLDTWILAEREYLAGYIPHGSAIVTILWLIPVLTVLVLLVAVARYMTDVKIPVIGRDRPKER